MICRQWKHRVLTKSVAHVARVVMTVVAVLVPTVLHPAVRVARWAATPHLLMAVTNPQWLSEPMLNPPFSASAR
jgi:hypothetical protein